MNLLNLLITIFIQISFILTSKLSSIFKLNSNLYFINQNTKSFYISLFFNNPQSANYYLDKLIINNINLEKKKCNIELNEIKCLIEENLYLNKFNNDEINIGIKNKMIKVKKIYYRIEKIKNKLILNILSKEKFIIKIFDKIIESIDNKYEIKNNNEDIINIKIYDKNDLKKIYEIKEKLNRLRYLEENEEIKEEINEEDIERNCAYIGEKIELETNLTLQDHRSVTLMKSNNVIATLTYSLSNPNTLLFDIPNNISIGNYSILVNSTNTYYYTFHKKIKIQNNIAYLEPNNKFNYNFTYTNTSEIESIQKFILKNTNGDIIDLITIVNSFTYNINSIIIKNTYLQLYNLTISNFIYPYILYGKYLCNDSYYEIANLNFYSTLINISNSNNIHDNSITNINFTFKGTYEDNSINSIIFKKNSSYNFTINSSNFTSQINSDSYTLIIIFDLINNTFKIGEYYISIINFGEEKNQNQIIKIVNCEPPQVYDENEKKCVNCENNKYYSYSSNLCVEKCGENEYLFSESEIESCYEICPDETFKYNKTKECVSNCNQNDIDDLKGENGECINKTFNLNKIEPTKLNAESNQSLNLIFEENFPLNRTINISINISINNIYSNDCNKTEENKFICNIDLSSIISDYDNYIIYYTITKRDNTTLSLNSNNITLGIIPNSKGCGQLYKILNKNSEKCEDCEDGKYYYNMECVDNCKEKNYYILEYDSKLICNESCKNKKEYRNNDIYCVSSCSDGYGYDNREVIDENNCYNCKNIDKNMIVNNNSVCVCNSSYSIYNNTEKKCIICSEYKEGMIVNNGVCVCDPNKYEFNYTGKNECNLCSSITKNMIAKNGKCVCDEGTELKKNYKNEIECIPIEDLNCINNNYCINGICDDSTGNIFCNCNEGYVGLNCDIGINNIKNNLKKLEEEISEELNNSENLNDTQKINIIENNNLTEKIKQISILYKYEQINDNSIMNNIKNLTKSVIDIYNNETKKTNITNAFNNLKEYIGLTLYYQNILSSKRRLDDNDELSFEEINQLYENYTLNLTSNKLMSSINKVFSYIIWNDIKKYDDYTTIMKKIKLPYLNTSIHNNVIILHTIYTTENDLNSIYTKLFNNQKILNINEINYVIDYNNINGINNNLFSYYYKKGINIYNSNDKIFTNKCYQNTKLNYDLTIKYRKYSLYQGKISTNSCEIIENNEELKLYFKCENNKALNYFIDKQPSNIILKDNYSNLPLKCLNKVNKLYKNLGFWIYFILILLMLILPIIFFYCLDNSISFDMINNDELDTIPSNNRNKIEKDCR